MRGNKVCQSCKANNGPRSLACKSCGQPFVIKGVLATAEEIERVRRNKLGIKDKLANEEELEILHILDFFDEVEPTPRELHINGDKVECYMSKDNIFRLRYTEEYMGIPLIKLHDRRYTLLQRNHDRDSSVEWNLVKRFKSLQNCLHYFRAVQRGEKELVLYKPGDDARKSRALTRHNKKMKKLKKVKATA